MHYEHCLTWIRSNRYWTKAINKIVQIVAGNVVILYTPLGYSGKYFMFKFRQVAIALTGLSTLAIGADVLAQSGSVLKFVAGSSSFVSPLIEKKATVA